jgi:pimeloyl-ACP methyl ester carboxylesterase
MFKIVIPGWGIPLSFYAALRADIIFNHGFFQSDANFVKTSDASVKIVTPAKMGTTIGVELPDVPYEIFAHSMGALIALADSPLRNQAEKLFIFGGFAKFAKTDDNPHGTPISEIDAMSEAIQNDPAKLLKRFHRLVAYPEKFRFQPTPTEFVSEALLKGLELLKTCDIRGDLETLRTSIKMFHGERDTVVSPELARDIVSQTSYADLTLIPNAGHALPFTQMVKT